MAVEKLSVSMDAALVKRIKGAASASGMSLSMWLAQAAEAAARQLALQEALADFDRRYGAVTPEEAEKRAAALRKRAVVVTGRRKRR